MDKKTILKKLKSADSFKELVASEHRKDHAYMDGMLVNAEDMRNILGETDIEVLLYVGLQEYEADGVWNELRIGNVVVDIEAPEEQTLEEWAEYFAEHLAKQNKRQKIVIPFSESDCQEIESGETFDWTFTSDKGESIDVHLRLETEEDIEG